MQDPYCTIGIDIGTTSAKVIAILENGDCIAHHRCRLELIHSEDGGAEQDVTAVYQAVMYALATVMEQLGESGYRVRQVGFSGAMHSILAIHPDSTPMMNAITWMDLRPKKESHNLWEHGEGKSIYLRTGTPIHPMSPLLKLKWMKQSQSILYKQAYKFVSIKEWIWYQWFKEWVIDESMASATGLFNTKLRTWDEKALEFVEIGPERLSRIVPTTYVTTHIPNPTLQKMGFNQETVFNIGATDGVLANLGVGAIEPDHMVLTIGTSCAVRVTGPECKTDISTRSFCYVLDEKHYVLGGPSNSGGIVVESLFKQILAGMWNHDEIDRLGDMLDAAGQVEIGDLLCLPYVAGERAPLWAPEAKAAWIGIDMRHTGIHLLRSVIEGVLFNAYWIASSLMELAGMPKYIVASGTLLNVDWIRQATADIFGIPVRFGHEGDASAIGAAWLAEIANGKRDWQHVSPNESTIEIVCPKTDKHSHYKKKFQQYREYASILNRNVRNDG